MIDDDNVSEFGRTIRDTIARRRITFNDTAEPPSRSAKAADFAPGQPPAPPPAPPSLNDLIRRAARPGWS